jgi:tetratricopeptide (TPR) repeat protein
VDRRRHRAGRVLRRPGRHPTDDARQSRGEVGQAGPEDGQRSPQRRTVLRPSAPIAPVPKPARSVTPEIAAKFEEANAALEAADFNKAALRFYEVVEAAPDASGPRVGYAVAEMALGRDAMALPVVLDGLTRTPRPRPARDSWARCAIARSAVEDALQSWREAFRLAPTDRLRELIVKAERELAAGRDYAYSAAAHFTLRYDGALDQDLVAAMTDFLEDRFRDITSTYRHAPSQPITVLLYPQQAFRDVTQAGSEIAGLYDGKIACLWADSSAWIPRPSVCCPTS